MSRLLDLLVGTASGRFPPADGTVTVFEGMPGPAAAVLGFTAHFAVCAPVEPAWVGRQLPAGDLSAPMGARFTVALADRLGADIGAVDAVLVAVASGLAPDIRVEPADTREHPRAVRARRYRRDVRVRTTVGREGMVLLGRGVAGRWEVSFEVDPSARGRHLGSALARAALGLLPAGTPVFAQVTPDSRVPAVGARSRLSTDRSGGAAAVAGARVIPAREADARGGSVRRARR